MPSGSAGGALLPKSQYDLKHLVVTLATNGPVPIKRGILRLTKATAAAVLLASPTAADEGSELIITSGSAAAHVVTGSFYDGVSGVPHTTATYAAFAGATMTLIAVNSAWNVKGLVAVTIT